jgi:hypothetical protein
MIANNACLGHYRNQDAAISAAVHAGALSADNHFPSIRMRIGAGRGFLAMRWTGGADMQKPSGPDLGNPARFESEDWK